MLEHVRTRRFPITACAVALVAYPGYAPSDLGAQELLSASDVVALEAPPPAHVVPYGEEPLQFGHLRLPEGPGPHPVVAFIHGGCWLSDYTIGHVGSLEQGLADAGYAVWSLEYRRVGDEGGGWPGTFQDIGRGLDHLRVLAPTYGLDLNRVVASGHSAGGHFALWAAARDKIKSDHELHTATPLPVQGVLGLAPAPDLEALHAAGVCGNVIDGLMGGSPEAFPDRYAAASPMQLAPLSVPQSLVIGSRDRAWGPIGRSYYERASEAGDEEVLLVEAEESGHFEMIVPTTSSWSVVLESLQRLFARIDRGVDG